MTEPIRYESLDEPLNDEERELMDPESWDWESAAERPPLPTLVSCLKSAFRVRRSGA